MGQNVNKSEAHLLFQKSYREESKRSNNEKPKRQRLCVLEMEYRIILQRRMACTRTSDAWFRNFPQPDHAPSDWGRK